MRSPDSRKWALTFMPSTSVPTLVSRSTSLNRPSGVASIWQWRGSAAGSSSWIELVSARPMVTTPSSNSKTRSSLSARYRVSLGMSAHFRRAEGETKAGIRRGGKPALLPQLRLRLREVFLDLAALRPFGRRELEGLPEVGGRPGEVALHAPGQA